MLGWCQRDVIFGGIIPIVWSDTGRKLGMYVAVLTQLCLQTLMKDSTTS
jgi:hypothetical protein